MLPDSIFSVFVQSLGTGEVLVSLLGIVSAAAFAGLLATKLGEIILPRPKETQVADFLPFERLREDGTTIECHDGTLVRVFAVKGADLAMVQPEMREAMLEARKSFIDSLGDLNVVARFITIRELVPLGDEVRHENISIRASNFSLFFFQISFIFSHRSLLSGIASFFRKILTASEGFF